MLFLEFMLFKIRFAVVVVGLEETVEVHVVIHLPRLATSLPEHFFMLSSPQPFHNGCRQMFRT